MMQTIITILLADLERGVGNPSLQTLRKILDVVGMEMVLQVKQTVK